MRMPTTALLATVLLAAGPLAGCIGFGDDEGQVRNKAPEPGLYVAPTEAWTGEAVAFDARNSTDADGSIVQYRFDFGDGNTTTVEPNGTPKVTHKYADGGLYVVTLTVTDDGAEGVGALSASTTVPVSINEKEAVMGQVLFVGPPDSDAPTGTYRHAFEVGDGAQRFEVNLTLESLLPLGSSELVVRVLDTDGKALAEETVSVAPNESKDVALTGDLVDTGEHTVEVAARTGGATIDGELLVLYFEPDDAMMDDEGEDGNVTA